MTDTAQIKTSRDAAWEKATTVDEKLNILFEEMRASRVRLSNEMRTLSKDLGTKFDKLNNDIISTVQIASCAVSLHGSQRRQQQETLPRDEQEDGWAYDFRGGYIYPEGPFRRVMPRGTKYPCNKL